ncbi:MAG: BatA domain-containing protein [Acidobacteria bacterium]|nr:BatA domain-containing protein [Acidobacteriota bacterium]
MSFLAPLFLVGLAAVAVPIFVHLIQRERRNVIEFPSLMFVQRIPYESVERRRIHNWPLLLLRLAALMAIVAAFARPFFGMDPVAAAATGDREVVILLDRSASMGYGDRWSRAQAEARRVIDGLGGSDRATLVLFDDTPEETVRATTDRGTLRAAVDSAVVSSGATRFAPALRLAQSRLGMSGSARKDAFLISDFQRSGWARQEDIQLPEGATITPVPITDEAAESVAVTSVVMAREPFSGAERVTVTAALANRGVGAVSGLGVALEIDGRVVERRDVSLDPESSVGVSFEPITVADSHVQAVIRAGTDALPRDNEFYFVLSPSRPVSVLVVQGEEAPLAAGLYLKTALDLGREPAFQTETVVSSRMTPAMLEGRSVVIVNDAALSTSTADLLAGFVERGGGVLLVLGDRSPAGGDWPLLPGSLSAPVERLTLSGGTLGYLDYSHPVFDEFRDPRNGSFASMRFVKYRGLRPAAADRVLARFDDGAAAMVERRVGSGRVIALASTLDGAWNDVPRHAMYLPLVHELSAYLAQYEVPAAWQTVGRMFDISSPVGALVRDGQLGATGAAGGVRGVVVAPSGQQVTLGAGGAESIQLTEQGFYSVRVAGTGDRRPYVVAVNLAPEESDLASIAPEAFLSNVTGRPSATAGTPMDLEPLTPTDMEKRQSIWWFLLVAGLMALLAEAALSNRLSRKAGGTVAAGR